MKMNLDPKMIYGILGVVVLGLAFLIYKGADANQHTPLPDPNMFKPAAKTAAPTTP